MDERAEAYAWWTILAVLIVLSGVCFVGFILGYKFQSVSGTTKCELDGVTCFDYKDTRLIKYDDFQNEVSCYTIDNIQVSCVRR